MLDALLLLIGLPFAIWWASKFVDLTRKVEDHLKRKSDARDPGVKS